MENLPSALYLPEQVRRLDAEAIGRFGIPGRVLMERAGAAAFGLLREAWPLARRLRVVCGTGNNAGDGYVVARLARGAGLDVQVLQVGDATRLAGDALAMAQAWRADGGETRPFAAEALASAEVVVDAIFGTGLDRPVEGVWAGAIELINTSGQPVLALDIPSGLHGGTGCVLGVAVRAARTATFIGLKAGLFTGEGRGYAGEIRLFDLEVPPETYDAVPAFARRFDPAALARLLPPRPATAHKGDCGHVLVVGGELGMGGAALMAGSAAARVGAGLVTVGTRAEHRAALLGARPELMCGAIEQPADLQPLLARASVVAIGPGLGRGGWGQSLLEAALGFEGPLVADADALNLLAGSPRQRADWVLTPHPGEAARLLGCDVAQVQRDRFAAAAAISERFGAVTVLKGAGTVVHAPGAAPWVSGSGNPGMATGGMGDVLTGAIAGLLAQGLPMAEAAIAAVWLHGAAADRAAAKEGQRGLLATDLLPHLRRLVNP